MTLVQETVETISAATMSSPTLRERIAKASAFYEDVTKWIDKNAPHLWKGKEFRLFHTSLWVLGVGMMIEQTSDNKWSVRPIQAPREESQTVEDLAPGLAAFVESLGNAPQDTESSHLSLKHQMLLEQPSLRLLEKTIHASVPDLLTRTDVRLEQIGGYHTLSYTTPDTSLAQLLCFVPNEDQYFCSRRSDTLGGTQRKVYPTIVEAMEDFADMVHGAPRQWDEPVTPLPRDAEGLMTEILRHKHAIDTKA